MADVIYTHNPCHISITSRSRGPETQSLTCTQIDRCINTQEKEGTLREICFDTVTDHCWEDSKNDPDISFGVAKWTNNSNLLKKIMYVNKMKKKKNKEPSTTLNHGYAITDQSYRSRNKELDPVHRSLTWIFLFWLSEEKHPTPS